MPACSPQSLPTDPLHRAAPDGTGATAARVAQSLEAIRLEVNRHLDRLERLARETSATAGDEGAATAALQARIEELEAEIVRVQGERANHEQEWRTQLAQLESDRRMLTEAWQQIEAERIAGPRGDGPGSRSGMGLGPGAIMGRSSVATAPRTAPRPAAAPTGDDPISRAILSQFQAVRRDVREHAARRGGS